MRVASFLLIPAAGALAAAAPANENGRYADFDRAVIATKTAMMGNPSAALRSADKALKLARSLTDSPRARVAIATAQWLDAEAHLYLNQNDAAVPLVEAALKTVHLFAKGTKLEGDLMRSKGALAEATGQMRVSLEAYQLAYQIFTAAHEDRSRAIALQDIGRIYRSAGDFERTLQYYTQSSDIYNKDPAFNLTNHNSRGELLWELGRLREAEAHYKLALAGARKLKSDTLQVRVLSNMADTQIDSGELEAAAESIRQALALSHGSGAGQWRPFVLGEAARLAEAKGDHTGAAKLFTDAFQGIDLTKSDMEFRIFHEHASQVYAEVGQPQLALVHLRAFQRLDSKARALTATYGAQLAAARFDFANQNARISALKAQRLQQQVQLEHQQERVRNIVAAAVSAITLAILGFLSFALITGRRSRTRLQRLNGDLERALKVKTEFLAMTSHEIRTPLNGILGMTQVMLSEPKLEPEVRDRIRLVHGAGETMRALVDDILDVAKMESEAVEIIEADTDLERLLDDLAAIWSDQARVKGIALSCDLRLPSYWLHIDSNRLRQIVFNILSNAVKFTESGCIAISARAEDCGDGEQLVISVEDSGIGIDPAQHDLIFEPFQQADASTTRRFGGTGLGLAICRKLARAMRGDVTVVSQLGAGATFTLRIPLKLAEVPVGSPQLAYSRATTLADAYLLLVEANMVAQGVIGGLLEPHIGKISLASDGDTALMTLGRQPIDHIVIEVASAGMSIKTPEEALRTLIAAASARAVHITLLTSATASVSLETLYSMGADQIVMKPIGGGALLSRLRELYQLTESEAAAA